MDLITKIERDLKTATQEGADCTDLYAQLDALLAETYEQGELDHDRIPTAEGFREWLTRRPPTGAEICPAPKPTNYGERTVEILKTAYMVQFNDGDKWVFYGADEMAEPVARKLASEIFSGEVPTRLVRIERSVVEDTPDTVTNDDDFYPVCVAPNGIGGTCGKPDDGHTVHGKYPIVEHTHSAGTPCYPSCRRWGMHLLAKPAWRGSGQPTHERPAERNNTVSETNVEDHITGDEYEVIAYEINDEAYHRWRCRLCDDQGGLHTSEEMADTAYVRHFERNHQDRLPA